MQFIVTMTSIKKVTRGYFRLKTIKKIGIYPTWTIPYIGELFPEAEMEIDGIFMSHKITHMLDLRKKHDATTMLYSGNIISVNINGARMVIKNIKHF